jgi:hypothetical protein
MRAQPFCSRDVLDKLGLRPGQVVRVVGYGDRQLLRRVRSRIGRPLTRKGCRAMGFSSGLGQPRGGSKTLPFLRPSIFPQGAIGVITPKRRCCGSDGLPYLGGAQLIPLGRGGGAGGPQDVFAFGARERHVLCVAPRGTIPVGERVSRP